MERIGAVSIRLHLWIDGYRVQQWGHGGDTNLGQASVFSSANDGSRTRLRRGNVTKIVLAGSLPHPGRWSFVISMDDGGISVDPRLTRNRSPGKLGASSRLEAIFDPSRIQN
jgi:hypothetical protein